MNCLIPFLKNLALNRGRSIPFTNGIPNLRTVDAAMNVYRGGQPTDEGWQWLKNQGVLYDVKLNLDSEGSDAPAFPSGIQQKAFLINLWQQTFGEPSCGLIANAVNVIKSGNVFVHCEHGQDRTGLVVAAYRVSQGWSKASAQAEMMECGFHPILLGLWRCWNDCF